MSDAGLSELETLRGLEFVDVRETRVSDDGVKRLESACDDVRIVRRRRPKGNR